MTQVCKREWVIANSEAFTMLVQQGYLVVQDDTIQLFQDLVNSGLIWKLQGHYGRTATALIKAGYIQE